MEILKLKIQKSKQAVGLSFGFTLIELLVVLGIMGMILGLVIIDFAGRKSERDLRIAQNQLVTNIRKVQSDSLFSSTVNNSKAAQYYILKFSASTPDRYFIQAITDVNTSPTLYTSQTVMLPQSVVFQLTNPFVITRPVPISPSPVSSACALVAFKSPFGKTYLNDGCVSTNPSFQSGDSYKKILDHLNNINNLSVSVDSDFLITLGLKNGSSGSKKVLIKGITGLVCPTVDGSTCSF